MIKDLKCQKVSGKDICLTNLKQQDFVHSTYTGKFDIVIKILQMP